MRKDQELSDPRSCLNKAEAEEPIFVLRAKDPTAPYAVRQWAECAVRDGSHEREKIDAAFAWANEMQRWGTEYRAAAAKPAEATPEG
jgi:hypothetical protein